MSYVMSIIIQVRAGIQGWLFRRAVSCTSALVFAGNLSRLVHEDDMIIGVWRYHVGRLCASDVDEVESHALFAGAIRLLTVVADGLFLVAFQMPLSARQTARPYSFRLAVLLVLARRAWSISSAIAAVHSFNVALRLSATSTPFGAAVPSWCSFHPFWW